MTTATESPDMDKVFDALGNAHRRAIIERLGLHPHAINQLAEMRGLSLPAISKHITILEDAGLVLRRKVGRTNYLALNRQGLRVAQSWLDQYHTYWGNDQATLENYVPYLERKDKSAKE